MEKRVANQAFIRNTWAENVAMAARAVTLGHGLQRVVNYVQRLTFLQDTLQLCMYPSLILQVKAK